MINETKKYYLVTLGCAKNLIDSEAMEVDLLAAGLRRAADIEAADLILLNSCGFIRDAKIETIDAALELHKARKKDSVLVMCGCLPARYDLTRSLGEVDIFLPSHEHNRLISRLREMGWAVSKPQDLLKRTKPSTPYGYIKIAEGCDNYCSYCAIPYIKGAYTSKSIDDIMTEATYLCREGVKELVLVGQDTSLYGKDYSERSGLPKLLDRLVSIESCEWIRLMYVHPAHLDDAIIRSFAATDKLVKYIDLPLQHINDRILGIMNRKTDRKGIESLISKLRASIPGLSLRTTLIVGFPGETDGEFGELLDFCEEVRFDHIGVFKFSAEDGTAAERLPERISEDIMEERYLTLLDLQNKISGELLSDRVGRRERVLLHEVDSSGKGYGRAWFQAPEVDGQVIIENCGGRTGDFVNVVCDRSDAYDLFGKMESDGDRR